MMMEQILYVLRVALFVSLAQKQQQSVLHALRHNPSILLTILAFVLLAIILI